MFRLTPVLLAAIIAGCATIPPEAPELSAELGRRIAALEEANLSLLRHFFDQKRADIDRFVEEEWAPAFAKEFFSDPTIARAWNTVIRENDKQQNLMFLVRVGPRLQAMINERRLELIKPLEELQRAMEQRLRNEYDQAKAMNNGITSFLLSAAEVTENRDRYLALAGVTDDRIDRVIQRTDDVVAGLVGGAQQVADKKALAKDFIDKVREIRDSI